MASKAIYTAVAVVAVAALSAAAWWSVRTPASAADERPGAAAGARAASGAGGPPTLVTVATVVRQDVPVVVEVNATVVSLNSVEVRPQVSNKVDKVHVKEGQFVRAGEPLFTLDDRADRANLDKARAQQMRDEALLADLERQYRRSQELLAQNFISKSAADNTLSQVEAQRAAIAADRAAIQAAQVALSYDSIRAPISGRIGTIAVFAGSLAQPGVPMVTVTQLDPIAVSFPVPEGKLQDLLAAARVRAPVMATVPGTAAPLRGVLSFVDNTVDVQAGTVRAKAQFDNASQALWPGQYVTAKVTVRVIKDATLVPQAAVITAANGRIVYVVAKDDTVQPRKVEIEYPFGDQAVLRGVEAGDRVVVEGKQNLRPGARVRVERSGKAEPAKKDPT
ncbi:efflux RND transporter periplasmic adaptor subunit [Caenimonas terrae]|uniref:Efflux RND transporter periplasmic adaptor subunit n=1 Tax=Caenimonas terrae TaxID=696074 RepID=A0ABW0NEC9_9BURK